LDILQSSMQCAEYAKYVAIFHNIPNSNIFFFVIFAYGPAYFLTYSAYFLHILHIEANRSVPVSAVQRAPMLALQHCPQVQLDQH
jgi:hypothetical protein